MENKYFARGKLMLSGEYAVLKGASALSLPCKLGQHLEVSRDASSSGIHWESFDELNNSWFQVRFDLKLKTLENSSQEMADHLQKILKTAFDLSKEKPQTTRLRTYLEFNRDWGLGSSSTLIHLISQWLKIDPMELFFKVANGSGYDVAAAGSDKPIIYQVLKSKANWREIELPIEPFKNCFFIHLNQKQKSDLEVAKFQINNNIGPSQINSISELTERLLVLKSELDLLDWIRDHEILMSKILNQKRIQDQFFFDFDGQIKSLGAWGGDFIMALGKDTKNYFQSKEYNCILTFEEMINLK